MAGMVERLRMMVVMMMMMVAMMVVMMVMVMVMVTKVHLGFLELQAEALVEEGWGLKKNHALLDSCHQTFSE